MAKEVLIVNCDGTYPLDSVVSLLKSVPGVQDIAIQQKTLPISQLEAVSEEVRRRRLLCGVFVVNAYESRLSINEENAGIGYAVLYRALLEAAQGRVLVVIGGDDRYKDGEQNKSVLSTWAYHKVAAQFDDTYLDGRRGFVFSWDERHNPVHEEALDGYLRAITSGQPGLEQPFKPTPPSSTLLEPEPIRPTSTATNRPKSEKKQTDRTSSLHTESQTERISKKDREPRSADGPRRAEPSDVTQVRLHDEETRRIRDKLVACEKALERKQHGKIIFVGYLRHGKLVPGLGTFKKDLTLPSEFKSYTLDDVKSKTISVENAAAIVYDDGNGNNTIVAYDLDKDEDKTSNTEWKKKCMLQ
ncbi:uncharacterized protein LOC144876777 [Branchiostoma floridae x Branchiostoma japonicum]